MIEINSLFFVTFWAVMLTTDSFAKTAQVHHRNRSVTKDHHWHPSERVGGNLCQTHIVLVSTCFCVAILSLTRAVRLYNHHFGPRLLETISTRFRDKLATESHEDPSGEDDCNHDDFFYYWYCQYTCHYYIDYRLLRLWLLIVVFFLFNIGSIVIPSASETPGATSPKACSARRGQCILMPQTYHLGMIYSIH